MVCLLSVPQVFDRYSYSYSHKSCRNNKCIFSSLDEELTGKNNNLSICFRVASNWQVLILHLQHQSESPCNCNHTIVYKSNSLYMIHKYMSTFQDGWFLSGPTGFLTTGFFIIWLFFFSYTVLNHTKTYSSFTYYLDICACFWDLTASPVARYIFGYYKNPINIIVILQPYPPLLCWCHVADTLCARHCFACGSK